MMEFDYDPPMGPLVILHMDQQVIVVDKPAGLLSVPGKLEGRRDCLQSRLEAAYPDALLVHRLDCDTSGVMIFARTKAAQGFLGQEFEKRRARKTYVARVAGVMQADSGHVDLPLCADWPNRPKQHVDWENGRPAQTDWQVISRLPNETRVHLHPLTGRSHQLRVHMAELGHPILGDPIYAAGPALDHPRMMLHAESLSLHHPETKQRVEYRAECPF
jgi:tRNA pseudouridine32 synthase/23S rRNA pseudouridine746 synthase